MMMMMMTTETNFNINRPIECMSLFANITQRVYPCDMADDSEESAMNLKDKKEQRTSVKPQEHGEDDFDAPAQSMAVSLPDADALSAKTLRYWTAELDRRQLEADQAKRPSFHDVAQKSAHELRPIESDDDLRCRIPIADDTEPCLPVTPADHRFPQAGDTVCLIERSATHDDNERIEEGWFDIDDGDGNDNEKDSEDDEKDHRARYK